jgi:SAM-dependent methyltransferase
MSVESRSVETAFWKKERHPDYEDYYVRQFAEPYRSTVHLCDFVSRTLGGTESAAGRAIDTGCGAGAVLYHLSAILPNVRWVGLDIAARHFAKAMPYFRSANRQVDFVQGDFYRLAHMFRPKVFDYAFSVQTLSWCPGYEDILEPLFEVSRRWIFVTSLFTDSDVEARIELTDYSRSDAGEGPLYYNVYSLRRFRDFCMRRGATAVTAEDFTIDVDLPKPRGAVGMGTYTRTLETGERLQFSGPLHLPWKAVAIRLA